MHPYLQQIRARTAERRARLFREFIATLPRPLKVVDLGGSYEMWRRWGIVESDGLQVVLLNNHEYDTAHAGKTSFAGFVSERIGDACAMTADDFRDFDLVVSNSMLEHLYTRDAQQRLAQAVRASGRPYFMQAPNRRCLVDPHFPHPAAPFFAMWPRPVQAAALCVSGLGGGGRSSTLSGAFSRLDNYVPVSRGDLRALFPQAELVTERSFGLPMSLVACSRGAR